MAKKPETREPKKGEGVPKETRKNSILPEFAAAVKRAFPALDEKALIQAADEAGYFDATMMRQVALLAEQAIAATGGKRNAKKLFNALLDAEKEKLHAVAVNVATIAFESDTDTQLGCIRRAASMPGIWPREMANFALHGLVNTHGFAAMFPMVKDWLSDKDETIRRVVAEGFRPRGVMTFHVNELKQYPELLLPVLEPLLDDPSLYVRNAVANSLNDIAKDHPDLVVKWAKRWGSVNTSPEQAYIIKRALRTLVASGHPAAMAYMGFGGTDSLEASDVSDIPAEVEINALLPFQVKLANTGIIAASCVVTMILDAPGKGAARRSKQYHIWKGEVKAGSVKTAGKKIHFTHRNSKPLERGEYRYSFTVNGREIPGGTFRF